MIDAESIAIPTVCTRPELESARVIMPRVSGAWGLRIDRARDLAAAGGAAASLLAFYGRVLQQQKSVYDALNQQRPCGSIEQDLPILASNSIAMLRDVVGHGPEPLAVEARTLLDSDLSAIEQRLLAYWRVRSDRAFFAKALLQAYGQWLADAGIRLVEDARAGHDNCCPHCGGAPQVSILDADLTSGDGGRRQLQCASCLTTWPFRRVVCAYCGEEDERKLAYFESPAFEHVRVDACDACGRYLKSVDLTRLGLAVPLVDEIAAAPLDAWAIENGYEKIELNLVGL